jgi:mannosyltransferase OCH1-like enzyme
VIPKKLHYCWFGGAPEDALTRRCIETWSRWMPDWQIKRWDERNSCLHFRFMRTTQRLGRWAKMSDLMRLLAIYFEGGIYLDTDVEVLKPLDDLLQLPAFLALESEDPMANNAVFGAERGHPFVLQCIRSLLRRCDGTEPANSSGPLVITRVLRARGLRSYCEQPQVLGDVTVFPKQYFYPFNFREKFSPECVTPDTYAVHWWAKRWV